MNITLKVRPSLKNGESLSATYNLRHRTAEIGITEKNFPKKNVHILYNKKAGDETLSCQGLNQENVYNLYLRDW